MYVAAKGGEAAIDAAHNLLAELRRGRTDVVEIDTAQIAEQLSWAVDRVMAEGALYHPRLAALAIKQAQGDLVEAIFLIRAFRTTLPRFGTSAPLETGQMSISRRISSAFKDIPGGQILGPTYDYTHRLLDFSLLGPTDESVQQRPENSGQGPASENVEDLRAPSMVEFLCREGLMTSPDPGSPEDPVGDLTRDPVTHPAPRDVRLQNLARGDEGFLLSLAYSLQRGFGIDRHPFLGEIRIGTVTVCFHIPELGFEVEIGDILVAECTMLSRFDGSAGEEPKMVQGYGLVFGRCERKAMAMSMIDRALTDSHKNGGGAHPVQNPEFVLGHSDNVEASGFVQHLKLPHYVDFQSELILLNQLRRNHATRNREGDIDHGDS